MDDLFWFYSTSAQMSVVLLGFWWAIVTFKHDEWMADPALKRIASWISLHFLLPGVMSLASLLAIENSLLWRTEFVLGGIGGAVASVMSGIYARRARIPPVLGGWGWKALMVLYLLIAVVAVSGPRLLTALSIEQKPLVVEGLLVSLLMILGVQFAWAMFSETRREPTHGSTPGP